MVFVSSCKDFWKFYVAYVTKLNSTEKAINPLKVKNYNITMFIDCWKMYITLYKTSLHQNEIEKLF